MKINIGVLGSEIAKAENLKIAEEVGREIARRGAVLVCGGRGGIMQAAAKGCKEEGGITVGILPTLDKSEANEYLDVIIPTSMGYGRNLLVASASDAVIGIDGNYGTLSEIALALNYRRVVIVIRGSGGSADFLADGKFGVMSADTPKDAVRKAIESVKVRGR